jgi:hypothetical protein
VPDGFAVEGSRVYLSVGPDESGAPPSLRVFDMTDPRHLRVIGRIELAQGASSVAAAGGRVYAVDVSTGLAVVDVSDPTRPRRLGSLAIAGAAKVAISDHYAYVSAGEHGLFIVDISDGLAPRIVAQRPSWSAAQDVVLNGSTAFVASGSSGLVTIDTTAGAPMRMLGQSAAISASRVVVAGARAFTVGGIPNSNTSRLAAYDVSSVGAPLLQSQLQLPGWPQALTQSGGYLFVASLSNGLQVVDAHDPATLRLIATVGAGDWQLEDLYLAGDHLLAADLDKGLRVIDIRDPLNPVQVGAVLYYSQAASRGLDLVGSLVYAAGSLSPIVYGMFDDSEHREPILSIDVSDPTRPTLYSNDVLATVPVHAKGILAQPDRLIVASGSEPSRDYSGLPFELLTHPIDPNVPPPGPPIALPDVPSGVAGAGERIFVAGGPAGLLALQIGHEAAPSPSPTEKQPPYPTPTYVFGTPTQQPRQPTRVPPIFPTDTPLPRLSQTVYLPYAAGTSVATVVPMSSLPHNH